MSLAILHGWLDLLGTLDPAQVEAQRADSVLDLNGKEEI